jgi:hypothetical protein
MQAIDIVCEVGEIAPTASVVHGQLGELTLADQAVFSRRAT